MAAGLAALALGSDGMGSIRIPSTWGGLFGVKPQRDRVPFSPHNGAWCGLEVTGPIARTVEDAALFLDVTTTMPAPDGGFVAAATRPPGRLRIALSTKVPPPLVARVGQGPACRGGRGWCVVARTGSLGDRTGLRTTRSAPRRPTRCRGISAASTTTSAPSRTRNASSTAPAPSRASAGWCPTGASPRCARRRRTCRRGCRRSSTTSTWSSPRARPRVRRKSAPTSVAAHVSTLTSVASRVPFQAMFNVTGQPAAVVPWGLDGNGIPTSIQMVGDLSTRRRCCPLARQTRVGAAMGAASAAGLLTGGQQILWRARSLPLA